MDIIEACKKANSAKYIAAELDTDKKNNVLLEVADELVARADEIIEANKSDMQRGRSNNMPEGLLDRLMLNVDRIDGIADGIRQVAALPDPIGEVSEMKRRPNGLLIGQKRVPMGVIGVIYEARPNVTADVFALCFKTGNVTILRGGKDAFDSNSAIVEIIQDVLKKNGIPAEVCTMLTDTTHEGVNVFMKQRFYVDLLIPRGGAGLIRSVVENANIPVIETGTGNCHIYVDSTADIDMAVDIIENAKTQRIGVCNAAESLVVHKDIASELLPALEKRIKQVEMFADDAAMDYLENAKPASDDDFYTEYLDYKLSVKTVSTLQEAIDHINEHNTGHSEAIITESYAAANEFLEKVDAACVYVNASTRFTDGFEFGFGAEIGISTQKLHARGPMGLLALTSSKYIIYGNGQVRK